MPRLPHPTTVLLAATLLLAAVLPPATPAHAEHWQGPGVQLQMDPQQPGQARLSLNGQPTAAQAQTQPDGSVSGQFAMNGQTHTFNLTAAGPNGQRTFRVGQHTAVLQPVARPSRPQNPGNAQTPGMLRLRQHTLNDPTARNMPSHTVLAPAGWQVEGGAWYASANYFNVLASHDVTVKSPEGIEVKLSPQVSFKHFQLSPNAGFHIPPQQNGQADGGYPVMEMPEGVEGWRQWLQQTGLPQSLPDATNVQVRDIGIIQELQPIMQQMVAPMQQNAAQQNQQNQMLGMYGNNFADGAFYAAHVTFERNGQRWEQLSLVGVYWLGMTMEYGRQLWWGMTPGRTFTVPEGTLGQHLPTLVAVADSLRKTPQWSKMQSKHAAKMSSIAAKGARDGAEITRKGMENVRRINQQTSDIIASTYDPNAGDKSQRDFINMIHEVEDYNNPNDPGTSVQLPSGYNKAYSNGNGEIIMTNDVLTDPNSQNLGPHTWSEMTVRP